MTKPGQMLGLKIIVWLNIVAMAALPIVAAIEGKDLGMAFFPIIMLGCTLSVLYPVIQSLNKRVQELERNLNKKQ